MATPNTLRKLSISFLCIFSANVFADSNDLAQFYRLSLSELGKVEITTATGNSTPLDRAPATATVITAAEIEAMGARNLDEVLESVPGVHVSLSALNRLDSIFSIRGIHTGFNSHVLLLINGVPVQFSLQGGRPITFFLPVSGIERIEVIRGPGSAIYSAEAYSGVVNVITKDHSGSENSVGLRAGSFGMRDLWMTASTETENWKYNFSFSYQKSDGDDSRTVEQDLQTTLDAVFGTSASLAPSSLSTRYEIINTNLSASSKHLKLNLWSWNSDDSGVGAGAAQAIDHKGGDTSDLYLADAKYSTEDMFQNWNHSARVTYQYYDTQAQLNLLPPGTVVPIGGDGNVDFVAPAGVVSFPDGLIGNPRGTTKDKILDVVSIYTGWEKHRLRLNIGYRHQSLEGRETKNFGPGILNGSEGVVDGSLTDVSGTPYVFIPNSSRTTKYISIQDEWRFSADWELTAGVRFDDYSDSGSTTNPRLALVWATSDRVTSKLLYGSAFRAPSFSEQFFQNNPVSLGNEKLEPETIDTLELSFNFDISKNVQSSFNLFTYKAKDMIEFSPDGGTANTRTADNSRDQNGQGFEVEFSWDVVSNLRLKSNYSWHTAEDDVTKDDIPDAPRKQFYLRADWEVLPGWFVGSSINSISDRRRRTSDLRDEIDDYTLVNLSLRANNLIEGVDLAIVAKNVTDEDAREPSDGVIVDDYPLESRSVWMGIDFKFQ